MSDKKFTAQERQNLLRAYEDLYMAPVNKAAEEAWETRWRTGKWPGPSGFKHSPSEREALRHAGRRLDDNDMLGGKERTAFADSSSMPSSDNSYASDFDPLSKKDTAVAYGFPPMYGAPLAKRNRYNDEIELLQFALPDGYFGSDRHLREEELSQRIGEPLTEEVKIARRLADMDKALEADIHRKSWK